MAKLALRGGVLSGNPITGAEIESLAKLPPLDVLQAQLVGVIVAPLVDVKDALLSSEPPDDRTAIGQLAELLPGFTPQHEKALRILVVAGMRAALAPATPSFLLVDGESGAGKGFLTALAAGILGQLRPAKIRPNMTPDDILRTIGENVVAGASILHLDEVGKIESMWASSGPLLVHYGHVA